MSLVEKAIAKLRETEGPARRPDRAAPMAKADSVVDRHLDDTASFHKMLDVDIGAMRAAGYMPEIAADKQFAERYRLIKRPLIERAVGKVPGREGLDPRVIMVTSALPGDGKTFTSLNLALSLARERDYSLLLVDADILKPHVSEIFGIKGEPGLMDALADETLPIDSLVINTSIKGLSILPAGQHSDGGSEMLISNRMTEILRQLLTANPRRIILLDSSPLLVTSESRALMKVAGQVLLVVRVGQTPTQAARDALELVGAEGVGGIVLNEARLSLTESFYGYGSYGSYGNEKKSAQ